MLCFLLFPQEFYNYIKRLIIIFNLKFVSIVFVVYGITQGFGEGWYYLFQRYFFKDILLLTPSQSQLMAAVARTPWNIKVNYSLFLLFHSFFNCIIIQININITIIIAYLWDTC